MKTFTVILKFFSLGVCVGGGVRNWTQILGKHYMLFLIDILVLTLILLSVFYWFIIQFSLLSYSFRLSLFIHSFFFCFSGELISWNFSMTFFSGFALAYRYRRFLTGFRFLTTRNVCLCIAVLVSSPDGDSHSDCSEEYIG